MIVKWKDVEMIVKWNAGEIVKKSPGNDNEKSLEL